MYEFRPPTVTRRVSLDHRDFLWSRVSYKEGITVVKTASGYRREEVHNPDAADIVTVYLGGHVYTIDDVEAQALTDAGYGGCLNPVLG
jgi:hypothetical protein